MHEYFWYRRRHRAGPDFLVPNSHRHSRGDGWWPNFGFHAPRVVVYNYPVQEPLHHRPLPPRPPQQPHRRAPSPPPRARARSPDRAPRVVREVHVQHRPYNVRVQVPKKVHFEFPHEDGDTHRRLRRKHSDHDLRRPPSPEYEQEHRPALHRRPSHRHVKRQPSSPNLHRQSSHDHFHYRHVPPRHAPQPPLPQHSRPPTIHILSYSLDRAPHDADADAILADHLPRGTAHLYTIPAYKFEPPPADVCELYSGVSPIVQEYVMRDSRARKAVRNAVEDLLDFRKREKRREREGRSWKRDVAISVCCNFGTHRSVSVAEKIRERLEDALGGLGVRIRVVHVHRRRGVRDAW